MSDYASVTVVAGAPSDRLLRGVIAALLLGAGAIHFAMAPDHFAEYWLFGVFFVVSAWFQLALAAAVLLRPSRPVFEVGFVTQAAIFVLWLLTRTSGIPIGPEHWSPEPVAAVDAVCSTFEIAAVIGFGLLLIPRVRTPW